MSSSVDAQTEQNMHMDANATGFLLFCPGHHCLTVLRAASNFLVTDLHSAFECIVRETCTAIGYPAKSETSPSSSLVLSSHGYKVRSESWLNTEMGLLQLAMLFMCWHSNRLTFLLFTNTALCCLHVGWWQIDDCLSFITRQRSPCELVLAE